MKDKLETCLGALVLLALYAIFVSYCASILWNYVIPDLFGLPPATPKQMFVLYVLVKMFFGITINKNS